MLGGDGVRLASWGRGGGCGRRGVSIGGQSLNGGRPAGVSGGTATLQNDKMLDRATASA